MTEKAKRGFLKVQDVVEVIASLEMQAIFMQKGITKATISAKTALHWLEKLGWTYEKLKHGMYLDGHKRLDVVKYREVFVRRWMQYEQQFFWWDHDGNELPCPNGFPVSGAIRLFHLILITYDESTFFQNDEHNTRWSHAISKSNLKAKGHGQLLMVSNFLTPNWGQLCDGDNYVIGTSESFIISHSPHSFLHSLGKPGSSLRLAEIVMGTSTLMICFNKWIMPSTFLKVSPKAGFKDFFYSTMYQATKSVHLTPYQPKAW